MAGELATLTFRRSHVAQSSLNGLRVAILVADDFEQVEMTEPRKALEQAGATTALISPKAGTVQGFNHDTKADSFTVDQTLDQASPDSFDAVLLPGGALNADFLRVEPKAQVIDFNAEDPVETIRRLTGGIGVDRAIDAVGVDANHPRNGKAGGNGQQTRQFQSEVQQIASQTNPQGDNWHPGDAPSQVLRWAVQALDKAGTLAIVGVYPQPAQSFPIGMAMNRNLTIKMGNCNHRKYIPMLLDLVQSGTVDPSKILTQVEPFGSVLDAFKAFDRREAGWVKVEVVPGVAA
jgi:hypothetical protein